MNKLTLSGQFKHGLLINAVLYTHFTLREADVGDMINAEQDAGSVNPVAFNAAMMAHQLTEVKTSDGKTYSGPFTLGMLKPLKQTDFAALRNTMMELEKLGESEPAA